MVVDVDRNERLALRGLRVATSPVTPPRIRQLLHRATLVDDVEKILDGANDIFQVNWLSIGLRTARSVARIGGADRATGVLVSPSLFLTNHHVFDNATAASRSAAYFNDELDEAGLDKPVDKFPFEPERFFVTDKALDFTLVAVPNDASAKYGFCRLIPDQGKARVGEHLTIIQHPQGGKKQIAFRANRIVTISDDIVQYETDTLRGSSGSPVFNDQWEMVALHRGSVARKNADGQDLKLDGSPRTDTTSEAEVDWIANEGVRVSRILDRVGEAQIRSEWDALRDELL